MLLVSASIRPSAIHGIGCFTNEPIRKGDIVWIFDARIDHRLSTDEVLTLPPHVQEYLRVYGYTEIHEGRTMIVLCGDHAKHMNHTEDPNLIEAAGGCNVAARDIAAGEELTCDYYGFDLNAPEKLQAFRQLSDALEPPRWPVEQPPV